MARLLEKYRNQVVPVMMREFGYTNALAVPRITKVVVHMGVGRAIEDEKRLHQAVKDMTQITGQKPRICRAKVPISGFRLRKGEGIGCMVTLRGKRMYEFLDRLISVAIPRIRDFRGLALTGFDRQGSYNFGITEQIVFPEVRAGEVEYTQGMHITVVISGSSGKERSLRLLTELGMPFAKPA